MGYVAADKLVVEFPIYGASSRSMKKRVIRAATGGVLATDAAHRVIVVRALDEISFELKEGDRVGLMGHNGSGKTTLLRVLAGAYEPVSGTVDIRGRVVSMLSVTLGMDGEATGRENIFLRGAVLGRRRREVEPLVDEIAEFAELGDYIDVPLRTYSSGMAMRLAFAISTSIASDIVLMDEWLSVGDAEFAARAQARLRRMIGDAKILVLASHDSSLLARNCNRILRLEHGKIVEDRPIAATREAALSGANGI
jgi:lipopolysaccharide transport system ATP-binding protein